MPSDDRGRQPVLISVGGLPATGKTTVARSLAMTLRGAYVRIDTVETAIGTAEGRFADTNGWEHPPGYLVGYAVVSDQLRNGIHVVAESVNAGEATRVAWRDTGLQASARFLDVEIVCSDPIEHRRRAEERVVDVVGLELPSWGQIRDREYAPWERDRLVVDTAVLNVDESVELIRATIET